MNNVFTGIPTDLPNELVETLEENANLRIERIVSYGHSSPPGLWYDQPNREWVVLLTGAARIRFEGAEQSVELLPGDFVALPAHRRHRVDWTTPNEPTIWLAVHYGD